MWCVRACVFVYVLGCSQADISTHTDTHTRTRNVPYKHYTERTRQDATHHPTAANIADAEPPIIPTAPTHPTTPTTFAGGPPNSTARPDTERTQDAPEHWTDRAALYPESGPDTGTSIQYRGWRGWRSGSGRGQDAAGVVRAGGGGGLGELVGHLPVVCAKWPQWSAPGPPTVSSL